jgi:hypothetical protein
MLTYPPWIIVVDVDSNVVLWEMQQAETFQQYQVHIPRETEIVINLAQSQRATVQQLSCGQGGTRQ